MTINALQFRTCIAEPTLYHLASAGAIPYSEVARNLCLGTVAQESLLGTYLAQEEGPALGIGQIEPATLRDLLGRLTEAETEAIKSMSVVGWTPEHNVVANLSYAFALVRLFYRHVLEPLPANTVAGLYAYYKQHYNTPSGSATLAQWRQNWLLTCIVIPP